MASPKPFILPKLPKELREAIYAHLESDDVKNLRATCSAMAKLIPLSFDRVFISANSLNLKVFRAIADDETIRHQVTEIVWDDARLTTGPELEEDRMEYEEDGVDPDDAVTDNGYPLWFKKGRSDYGNPRSYILPDYLMGIEESWAYYKPLLQDQRQVLASDADIKAFKYGLQRFPSLKRRCVEYDDLVTLLKRPGFRYLSLDLFTGLLEREDWESYKSGLLHDALAQAKDLEHICLRSTMEITGGSSEQLDGEEIENYVFPLRTIFPIDQWPRLRNFGISHMLVQLDDLMELFSALPRTLRSVELSNLAWGSLTRRTRELLRSMRDVLDWRSRPVEERHKVHMVVSGAAFGDGDKDGCNYVK
uniref:F-box domain-containing protein n=1 Tax=Fusarium oxysporum (strain Fo5176) TaxID=660025 RepID=A0A0D2YHN6_FUSOF